MFEARKKSTRCALILTDQTEKKGCRLSPFECEDKGVYNEVNDRSPRHEERAQDAPLSSVWWSEVIENRIMKRYLFQFTFCKICLPHIDFINHY